MINPATRALVARLISLLANERSAMADFLAALAEIDARRAWEELGYPSLFDFLVRELGMSRGTAFYRKTAVELVRQYPEVLEALRDGRLCITTVHALSKAITPENRAEVLPRFFHVSKQEAKALAAEIAPAVEVPRRDVVTTARAAPLALDLCQSGQPVGAPPAGSAVRTTPTAAPAPRPEPPEVEPLTPTETRLHITVSPEFLRMLDACKRALSHSMPGASAEDVLAVGMKLILERDAKKKALVEEPRASSDSPKRATETSRYVPAAVRREVWKRDHGRCQWPLASGGVCGSEFQLELDHVVPFGLGGATAVENLRVLCGPHNELAARLAFGQAYLKPWCSVVGSER